MKLAPLLLAISILMPLPMERAIAILLISLKSSGIQPVTPASARLPTFLMLISAVLVQLRVSLIQLTTAAVPATPPITSFGIQLRSPASAKRTSTLMVANVLLVEQAPDIRKIFWLMAHVLVMKLIILNGVMGLKNVSVRKPFSSKPPPARPAPPLQAILTLMSVSMEPVTATQLLLTWSGALISWFAAVRQGLTSKPQQLPVKTVPL